MSPEIVQLALDVAFWFVIVLVAACMVLVILGPGNVDRIVATDLGLVMIAVALGLLAARQGTSIYMDAALLIAILSFLVTVVVARHLETGESFR